PLLDDLPRRGVRVVLTGAGGDQLMQPTGYEVAHHLRRGHLRAALAAVASGSDPPSGAAWRRSTWRGIRCAVPRLGVQGLWAFAPRAAAALGRLRRAPPSPWPWLSRSAFESVSAHLAREKAEMLRLHPDRVTAE